MRTEPEVSVPKAMSAKPKATADADPLEDPPGTIVLSNAFRGVPKCGLTPSPEKANSDMFTWPIMIAPAERSLATIGASLSAG
ncbi:hypothetical protein NBRC116589_24060 [Ruegeria sp. HU-ET01832]